MFIIQSAFTFLKQITMTLNLKTVLSVHIYKEQTILNVNIFYPKKFQFKILSYYVKDISILVIFTNVKGSISINTRFKN